jgi:hypothetical protein
VSKPATRTFAFITSAAQGDRMLPTEASVAAPPAPPEPPAGADPSAAGAPPEPPVPPLVVDAHAARPASSIAAPTRIMAVGYRGGASTGL